jgi:hypothetical protein
MPLPVGSGPRGQVGVRRVTGPRVRPLGQFLAYLVHRHARAVGGDADLGNNCGQGVLPEVVSLPPGDLVEQVNLGPPAQRPRSNLLVWLSGLRRALCC